MAPLQGAFPDNGNAPAFAPQLFIIFLIPRDIPGNLFAPELFPGLRPFEQITVMAVPEATIHEDHSMVFRKDQIRLARQSFQAKTIAKTAGIQPAANYQLRLCIPAMYRSHIPATGFFVMNISQITITLKCYNPISFAILIDILLIENTDITKQPVINNPSKALNLNSS